jgi:hypothetical protein
LEGARGMTAYEIPKAPHIARLLELYDAGERDYAVLASACQMTRKQVNDKLSAYSRIEARPNKAPDRYYVSVRVPSAIINAAKQRGDQPSKLVTRLISVIARDNLVNAVLDDGGEAA